MRNTTDQNSLAATAGQSNEGASKEFSRRSFAQLLTLGALSLAVLPPVASSSQQAQDPDKVLERLAGLAEKARAENPDLPGFKNLEKWAARTLPQNLGPQEAELLQGALYLKAVKLLEENQQRKIPAPTLEAVREVFTSPEPLSCVTKDHLDKLLKTTQMKVSRQPDYELTLKAAAKKAITLFGITITITLSPRVAAVLAAVLVVAIIVAIIVL